MNAQLSTTDDRGNRLWLYPADVSGRYRTRRNWVVTLLLFIFLLLPWIRIQGNPAVLIDLWHGHFSILGFRFWWHDTPILIFLFGGAAVFLAFVTSVWGRVWCGWACPQTVFIDAVYRRVERWIEGDAIQRRALDSKNWTVEKIIKKTAKWGAFLFISLVVSHSFLAYFLGTDALAQMMRSSPAENPVSFLAMAGIAGAVLFNFGWFREQFCTLLCPYGRFQSVLMDSGSLAVAYHQDRGEPRRGLKTDQMEGDCVNCFRCVRVCPTGIDIRDGLQLECIACTACIDACDTVMEKIGKEKGLIRYHSVNPRGWGGRTRTLSYFAVLLSFAIGLTIVLSQRKPLELTVIRAVGAPYEEMKRANLETEVVNRFKLELLNRSFHSMNFDFTKKSEAVDGGVQFISAAMPVEILPGERKGIEFFVRFPLSMVSAGKGKVPFEALATMKDSAETFSIHEEVPLVGPTH